MRFKIIAILIIIAGVLYSCMQKNPEPNPAEGTSFTRIREFKYKEHDYIYFCVARGDMSTAGVVHNPECHKCFQMYD